MIHQIKTFDGKLLVELKTSEHGTELFISNEMSEFRKRLIEANKHHGTQFDDDLSSLNQIHQECKKTGVNPDVITKNKFNKVSESWGLTYENIEL
jgi:hypothetical protein